jgi:hypothetical protein
MTCKLRKRRDDIPKLRKGERTWACEECGAIIMSSARPRCRQEVLAEVRARHAFAEGEADILDLDHKVKPQ